MDDVNYLFRKSPRHLFITTKDPEYRYEILCGRCEYPIAPEDEVCPRCQMALEECPICSQLKHTRSPRFPENGAADGKVCPVCRIRRVAFGEKKLSQLKGSFCTNIYGCPAGGLLLAKGEFAVLPENASRCPVCEHETLLPLGIEAFSYQLQRCLFCSTAFGRASAWAKGWLKGDYALRALGDVMGAEEIACPICGRSDLLDQEGQVCFHSMDDGAGNGEEKFISLSQSRYLHMCELGRILILFKDDAAAFSETFSLWFDPAVKPIEGSWTVGEILDPLLAGTYKQTLRLSLQKRLDHFLEGWKRRLGPFGVSYRVAASREPSNSPDMPPA